MVLGCARQERSRTTLVEAEMPLPMLDQQSMEETLAAAVTFFLTCQDSMYALSRSQEEQEMASRNHQNARIFRTFLLHVSLLQMLTLFLVICHQQSPIKLTLGIKLFLSTSLL